MSRTVPESVLLLAADVKHIREAKGLSIADLTRAMHQGADVIESIERSLLMDNPIINPIYLRPMLRKYGQILGLDEKRFLRAVDLAYEGTFESDWREREVQDLPDVQPTQRPIVVPERPVLQYELEPVRMPSKRFEFSQASKQNLSRLVGIVLGFAAVGAFLWGAVTFWPTAQPSVEEPTATIPVPEDVPPPTAAWALPDRITLIVQADSLPVRVLRIQLDRDQRRPYWIEPRQARTFSFADSVRLYDAEAGTGQLGRIVVSVEGRTLPKERLTGREVVLRRAELATLLAP